MKIPLMGKLGGDSPIRKKHKLVPKGWGYELWIENNDLYCGKILFVKKGYEGSLHHHPIKDETFYILDGLLNCTLEEEGEIKTYSMVAGDSYRAMPGTNHRLHAVQDTHIIEFSTPHSDDDVVRIEEGDKI